MLHGTKDGPKQRVSKKQRVSSETAYLGSRSVFQWKQGTYGGLQCPLADLRGPRTGLRGPETSCGMHVWVCGVHQLVCGSRARVCEVHEAICGVHRWVYGLRRRVCRVGAGGSERLVYSGAFATFGLAVLFRHGHLLSVD